MSVKTFTLTDLTDYSTRDKLYLAIHGKVYDCTSFIDEHPGGEEVLLDEAARDASESFEDVGHSEEARAMLDDLYVGDLKTDGTEKTSAKPVSSTVPKPISHSSQQESGRLVSWVKSFF
ncbi:hypothetical protein DFQ27_006839 [Actinomortierella ambigua]|uniref:Cytochrome b5 heme-binding domain-containing protein n=1 Tax=Actinomortierella ambigua TaxID=1343610 RepID=A0A9P6U0I3_9FUNG|nr:hypothetical protein DFQ27_006839 [Actinomortierella ambigua]